MRRWRSILCVVCLLLMIPAILRAQNLLPLNAQPLIEEKYGGWAGVLRLWVCERWATGSGGVSGWLNRCIAAFEKAHGGVYVQPEYVDAGAIAEIGSSGILPPDLILFPPGVLGGADGLAPLERALPVRSGFELCGRIGETAYAVPVMAGGYLWAYNAARLDGIPNTWRDAGASVAVPSPGEANHWGAALLALCSARYSEDAPDGARGGISGEMDLGLSPAAATPAPSATPAPEIGALSCALPADFAFSESAWRDFTNGDADAMPVTQREVRRLEALSDQGRGVDWRLQATGAGAFTDQVLLAAAVDRGDDGDAPERRALCLDFIDHLLSDACQGELYRAGAFSVTEAASGYAAGDALSAFEQSLRAAPPAVPNAFDAAWRETADAIVRKLIADGGDAPALWAELADALRQKSEH